MQVIAHDETARRFTTPVDGGIARLDYELSGSAMSITHTHVPVAARGQGIAARMMQAALSYAGQKGLQVLPVCAYAASYLQRLSALNALEHQEGLLDEALDESFPASDPPAIGHVD